MVAQTLPKTTALQTGVLYQVKAIKEKEKVVVDTDIGKITVVSMRYNNVKELKILLGDIVIAYFGKLGDVRSIWIGGKPTDNEEASKFLKMMLEKLKRRRKCRLTKSLLSFFLSSLASSK